MPAGGVSNLIAHLRAALAINPSWGDGCYNLANLLSAYEATTAS